MILERPSFFLISINQKYIYFYCSNFLEKDVLYSGYFLRVLPRNFGKVTWELRTGNWIWKNVCALVFIQCEKPILNTAGAYVAQPTLRYLYLKIP